MGRRAKSLLITALLASTSVFFDPTIGRAEVTAVIDEGWIPTRTLKSGGHQAVRFRDIPEYYERVSTLLARMPYWKACKAIDTAPCSTAPAIEFSSVLQPCATATELDCVVEFGTTDKTGARVPAVYVTPFPKSTVNSYPANPAVGLPLGGTGGLWSVSAESGAPIRTHYVGAMVHGTAKPGERVTFTNFYATLSPVEIATFGCRDDSGKSAGCTPAYVKDNQNQSDPDHVGYVDQFGLSEGLDCVMSGNLNNDAGTAECAVRKSISRDVNYYLTVRLSQAVSGWMHGRMAEPNITIADIPGSSGAVTLSIAAKAVSVPAVDLERKFSELPATLQDAYRTKGGWRGADPAGYGVGAFETDPLLRNRESRPTSFGENSIAELEAWMPVVKDTAIADLSTWAVRTLGRNELGAAQGCVTDKNKVAGIVTTNATVYKAAAPVYDTTTKSLSYTVSAPHYASSGALFKGVYSLIVRSDVARCIYDFTAAPIKSSIEVIDTGAEASTVVTNVSESDGWIRLSASGFTHSSPTIRAKMTQEPAAPQPRVAVGRVASRSALLKWAGLATTKSSRVTLSVARSSRKSCVAVGTSVKGVNRGVCLVSIKVQAGTRRTSKTVAIEVG